MEHRPISFRVGVGVGVGVDDGAGFTVTVTCFVTVPPQPVAVKEYVVVLAGLTERLPGAGIPPMFWSMLADDAFVTAPQASVVASPALIGLGEAVNDAMTGGPGQAGAAGGFAAAGGATGGFAELDTVVVVGKVVVKVAVGPPTVGKVVVNGVVTPPTVGKVVVKPPLAGGIGGLASEMLGTAITVTVTDWLVITVFALLNARTVNVCSPGCAFHA